MIKIFFYWLFHKSKTLKNLLSITIQNNDRITNVLNEKKSKQLIDRISKVLQINQNRFLRHKWKRITTNKNSPFYIYK